MAKSPPEPEGKLSRFFTATKGAGCGALIGLLLAVLAGGFSSTLLGQPFSGQTGLKVFPQGMVFPGLFIFAPVTAGIGALLGVIVAVLNKTMNKGE